MTSPPPAPPERVRTLARAAGGGGQWLRRYLLDPALPMAAIEVRARSVGVVRLAREGRGVSLAAAASLDLPEGVVRLSMTQPNLADPGVFQDTLRSVLERAGALHVGRVALVLPDPVARVALLSGAEAAGQGRQQREEMIRFRPQT